MEAGEVVMLAGIQVVKVVETVVETVAALPKAA
jgi:hypothetical protein